MDYSKHSNRKRQWNKGKHPDKIYSRIWLNILRVACVSVLVCGFSLAGILLGGFMGIIDTAPDITMDSLEIDKLSTYIYDQDGNEINKIRTETQRVYIPIEEMSENLLKAVVAVEDSRFYEHNGIDIQGILRAGVVNLQASDSAEGGSTITQQVIKNLALTTDKNWTRKIQEWYLALRLEYDLTQEYGHDRAKDMILEKYLNFVNLGNSTYGVEAAANRYFNKSCKDLTLSEAAILAGVINAPTRYDPITNKNGQSQQRQQLVLRRMRDQELITEEEYQEALADPVFDRIVQLNDDYQQSNDDVYSYFVDAVLDQVQEDFVNKLGMTSSEASNKLNYGGLKIYITQDASIQEQVDSILNDASTFSATTPYYQVTYYLTVFDEKEPDNMGLADNYSFVQLHRTEEACLAAIEEYKQMKLPEGAEVGEDYAERTEIVPQPQASMSVIDYHNGHVLALYGGRGEKTQNRVFNRAVDAERQPGSTFKIIASYAAGLDTGTITAASVFDDVPFTYGDWSPGNWWGNSYEGLSNVRRGIARSMNIVTVKAMLETGVQTNFEYAKNFGFSTLTDDKMVPSLCLGAAEVTNLELTAAYGAIANGGVYIEPILYTRVEDSEGNLVLENVPESHAVIKPTTAWLLTDMMRDVVKGANGGTGTAARFSSSMDIAGKTGTTSEVNDQVFAGYTPYYVAAIWTGFDQNVYRDFDGDTQSRTLKRSFQIAIWGKVMGAIHEGLEAKTFDQPDGIVQARVCKKSGLLATDLCEEAGCAYSEYFASGTVPTDSCETHVAVTVCTESGLPPTEYCPEDLIETKIFIQRTAEQLEAINPDDYGKIQDFADELPAGQTPDDSSSDVQCNIHTKEWYEQQNNSSNIPDLPFLPPWWPEESDSSSESNTSSSPSNSATPSTPAHSDSSSPNEESRH